MKLRIVPKVLASLALVLLAGCASARVVEAPQGDPYGGTNGGAAADAAPAKTAKEGEKADEDEGHGILMTLLLYLPNRVIDLFDVARFGVDVGPGIGVHVQATDALQAKALTSVSAGVGLQSLRHSPIHVGSRAGLGVGPVEGSAELGDWYQSPADVRVEAYVLLVGAHVAVEPVEILDAILGFLFIDIEDDDL